MTGPCCAPITQSWILSYIIIYPCSSVQMETQQETGCKRGENTAWTLLKFSDWNHRLMKNRDRNYSSHWSTKNKGRCAIILHSELKTNIPPAKQFVAHLTHHSRKRVALKGRLPTSLVVSPGLAQPSGCHWRREKYICLRTFAFQRSCIIFILLSKEIPPQTRFLIDSSMAS